MACLGAIAIIMGVSFAGDLLGAVLPLPVPGSIYALVIMLLLLLTRAVKLEKVRAAGYDIRHTAAWLQDFYLNAYEENS